MAAVGARAEDSTSTIPWGTSQKPAVIAANCPAFFDSFFWSYLAHDGIKEEDGPSEGISQSDWSNMGPDERLSALWRNCNTEYQDKQVYDSILPQLSSADQDAQNASSPLTDSQRRRLVNELRTAVDNCSQGEQALVALAGGRTDWAEMNTLKQTYDDVQRRLNEIQNVAPQKAALSGAQQRVSGSDLSAASRNVPSSGSGGDEAQEAQAGAAFAGSSPSRSLAGASNSPDSGLPRAGEGAPGNLAGAGETSFTADDSKISVANPGNSDPEHNKMVDTAKGAVIGAGVGGTGAGFLCASNVITGWATPQCVAIGAVAGTAVGATLGGMYGQHQDEVLAAQRQKAAGQQQLQPIYTQSVVNP